MERIHPASPWLLAGLALFGGALLWKSGRFDPAWSASPSLERAAPGRAEAAQAAWNPAPWIALVPEEIQAAPELGRAAWPRAGVPEVFPQARMADKIDGAIAHFDRWGVKGLVAATFGDPAEPARSVELSLYEMGSTADAMGVLQSLRPPGALALPLGEGAWVDQTTVAFRAGPLFVLAVGSQSGAPFQGAAMAAAVAAAAAAPRTAGANDAMAALALLPEEGRNAGSEGYFRRDAFGGAYPFLENVFTADYGDPPVTLLACRPPAGAGAALRAWRAAASGPAPDASAARLWQTAEGWEGGCVHGEYLLGVIGAQDQESGAGWLERLAGRAARLLEGEAGHGR